ncbi:MAG: M23 family metallopeptidase [Candidatus Azobacteroides sp.]|nr:M23 family metallopeptidase [Candidatus Azobacteroides sp.]
MEKKKRKHFWRNIKVKYKLTISDESHLQDVFSIRLSKLRVIVAGVCLFLFLFFLVGALIWITPVKNFLPGYLDAEFRKDVVNYSLVVDSLSQMAEVQEAYVDNLKSILQGDVKADTVKSIDSVQYNLDFTELHRSKREEEYRKDFEEKEKYNLSLYPENQVSGGPNFFPPVKGIITAKFNSLESHFGVDLVAAENQPVVAVSDGTVIYCGFDMDVGYVIQIQHNNEFISIYKHNARLLKKIGDAVKGGEAIAIVGNTGKITTGAHLHFELCHKGSFVDPEEYIVF